MPGSTPTAPAATVLVAVTDHAVQRYAQRVGRGGALDLRPTVTARVAAAWAAGRAEAPSPEVGAPRGTVWVRDERDRALVYVCRHDVPRGELIVITLWEEGEAARVPRRFTDALRARGRAGP